MLGVNGKNAVKKNEVIFKQGDTLTQVGIVLSGKVLMQNDWMRMVRGQGALIALNDIPKETYGATYIAMEDSVVFALPISGEDAIRSIVAKNVDYRAIMVASQFKYVTALARIRQDLYNRVYRLYQFAQKSYRQYISLCQAMGIQVQAYRSFEA